MARFSAKYRDAGISPARLMELRGICRQYRELRRRLRRARAGIEDREARAGNSSWHRPDPTAGEAVALADHPAARRIALIEDCVRVGAGPGLYDAVLECVADGHGYEQIVPTPVCGKNQFYRAVQDVYIALDGRLSANR